MVCIAHFSNAQSFAINTDGSSANASALLDVKSTGKGVLVPRMNKAQKNAIISPATGLLVFQDAPDSVGFYFYNGTAWLWMATATNITGWATTGNAGTDTSVNFIGTTNNMPLRFKVNNQWNGQFDPNNSNYFIGSNAGRFNTGIVNTAFGASSLPNNNSGNFNTAFGGGAMISNTTGSSNVAMGNTALANHKFGDNNVALGSNAMNGDTSGTNNTAVGAFTLFQSRNVTDNVAIGQSSLFNHKSGNNNVAIGSFSMFSDTTGVQSVAVGVSAMRFAGNSGFNTAVGNNSLSLAGQGVVNNGLFGNFNTALGYNSAKGIRSGFGNVVIGNEALSADSNSTANVVIGNGAMSGLNSGGTQNIAIGYFAMADAKGNRKTAIGVSALNNDTSAIGNTAVGYLALSSNRRGVNNVAMGVYALQNNISGSRNTAIGDSALRVQSFSVGNATNHFTNNTAIGYKALLNNQPTLITDGLDNTALGSLAGQSNTTGTGNTFLGSASNTSPGTLTNATAIGFQSQTTQSNSMVLGSINGINGATSSVNVGVGTNTPDARLHIVRNGASGGTYQAESGLILENSSIFTMQFSTPNGVPALIRSGNASTPQRSGITFEADSSINFNSGGSLNRMIIDNTGFVGVRTSAPLSYLDVSGSTANAIQTSSVSVTLDQFDHTHIITPTVAAVTVTIPAASTCTRREYVVVNQDNAVHNFSITYLDFTNTAVTAIAANSSITIQSNGTNWYRIR